MAKLGNPLKMLLKKIGSVAKNQAWSGNLKHIFLGLMSS